MIIIMVIMIISMIYFTDLWEVMHGTPWPGTLYLLPHLSCPNAHRPYYHLSLLSDAFFYLPVMASWWRNIIYLSLSSWQDSACLRGHCEDHCSNVKTVVMCPTDWPMGGTINVTSLSVSQWGVGWWSGAAVSCSSVTSDHQHPRFLPHFINYYRQPRPSDH